MMTKETLKYMLDSMPMPKDYNDDQNVSFEGFYFSGLEVSIINDRFFFVMPIAGESAKEIKTFKSFKAGKNHVFNYLSKFF